MSLADKHTTRTGTGANVVEEHEKPAAKDATVVHDKPIVERKVVHEHPEVVHQEHHVQPVVELTERHVQPVHKVEVSAEHPVVHKERLVGEEKLARQPEQPAVLHDEPLVKKKVVHEHPEVVHQEHHVQPVVMEKERHIEPVHKTQVTEEHPVVHEERVVQEPATVKREHEQRHGRGAAGRPTVGQKVKGTMKQLAGVITGNEAQKEEGKLLRQGVDPRASEPNLRTF